MPLHVAAPAYAGPTPADPFGGGTMDIFDVLEMAESQHLAAATSAPAQLPVAQIPAAQPPAIDASTAVIDAIADASSSGASGTVPPATLPVAEAAPPAPAAASREAPAEPQAGPAIRPVVIGQSEPTAEKKRGWWRR